MLAAGGGQLNNGPQWIQWRRDALHSRAVCTPPIPTAILVIRIRQGKARQGIRISTPEETPNCSLREYKSILTRILPRDLQPRTCVLSGGGGWGNTTVKDRFKINEQMRESELFIGERV